ncbi:hypothetical protein [Pedobacter sp. SYSU D00535]|uniref:hypothetical protein n=1 Tax=Pedobacter sp. SYSU D00535 TaxID=2810308 RepID=UPI001A9767BC|nr:hypothetical protein [Pedobacter sp. SYSU D00535]
MRITRTLIVSTFILLTVACKDDPASEPETQVTAADQRAAESVMEVDRFINELEFIARSIRTNYPNQTGILSGTTITAGRTDEGKEKYDITFNNLLGADNKRRTGMLSVVLEDAVENGTVVAGKHVHVRSDDETKLYSVEGVKFKGSLIYSNIAAAKATPSILIDHLNAQSFLLKPSGEEVKFSSTRKSKWLAGNATTDIQDDKLEMSQQDYSLAIKVASTEFIAGTNINPVILDYGCAQSLFSPKKGVLKVEHLTGNTRKLVFGNGNCSDTAVVQPFN